MDRRDIRKVRAPALFLMEIRVGETGTILTSSDGSTWVSRTSGTTNFLHGVSCGDNAFVAVGTSNTILSSADNGTTWTTRTSATNEEIRSTDYRNSIFMAVGLTGTI